MSVQKSTAVMAMRIREAIVGVHNSEMEGATELKFAPFCCS